ncbi:MAG: DivIVA domain-containing protein [Gemmatimonadales bacterium]|nr:DivIVA domain-containing protein [Gemmatimonadales bacterium]
MTGGGDAFHLTPHDVRAQEFSKVLRGYDPAHVEEFRERVAQELDRLLRERAQGEERHRELLGQVRALETQLAEYHTRERALNEALITAQQLRADTKALAEREADMTLRDARAEADRLLHDAKAEGQRLVERAKLAERMLGERIEQTSRQFQGYVGQFRSMVERQLAELAVLQLHAEQAPTPAAPAQAPANGGPGGPPAEPVRR